MLLACTVLSAENFKVSAVAAGDDRRYRLK
jgi:hypothetical protein